MTPESSTGGRDLRSALLQNYRDGQSATASGAVYENLRAFWPLYTANYSDLLSDVPRTASIIDLGSGPGSLVAWLRDRGFASAHGVDLSPGDVAHADAVLGQGAVVLADARDHLLAHVGEFDVVIMKAILEHIPKNQLLGLVDAVGTALAPGGRALIDVPNMDWLLAGHERYMDLTHEVGFTAESLHALLSIVFADVTIRGSRQSDPTRSQRWLRPLVLRIIRRGLYIVGEGASDTLFANRSLIAVAQAPR